MVAVSRSFLQLVEVEAAVGEELRELEGVDYEDDDEDENDCRVGEYMYSTP